MRLRPVFIGILVLAASAPLAACIRRDYRTWRSLGEGGIPSNPFGWLIVTFFRLVALDARDTSHLPLVHRDSDTLDLPDRSGPRPIVGVHPIPQRQLDQEPQSVIVTALDELFAAKLARYSPHVTERESQFERNHSALYVDAFAHSALSSTGEVAHYHRPQGSMHFHLRPEDARVVIERGWGELHRLAGRVGLPTSYTFVYSPRDLDEVKIIDTILTAALEWALST